MQDMATQEQFKEMLSKIEESHKTLHVFDIDTIVRENELGNLK